MPKVLNRLVKKAVSSQDKEQMKQIVPTDLSISDKATKRVIAPFVRIVRKGQKLHEVEEGKQFSLYLQKKPSVLIRDLSSFLSDSVDLPSLLHETADVVKNVTRAAGVTLYMMDPATNEIYQSKKTPVDDRFKIRWKIKEGSTVATYVAYKKEYVMVDDILEDDRFPEGIGYQTDKIKSVLCIPVVTPDGECFAVIELCKLLFDSPFTKDDLKITLIVTGWMGAAIHQNSRRLALQRQQQLNDYLLDLTKCYFGESVFLDKMILEIIKFAKVTLNAERGSIFLIDREITDELVADLFEEGGEDNPYKKAQKVRFSKERGVASLVARTGVTVNVKDAYKDARFNKDLDQKTGFITRSILCMPIMGVEAILGVVQMVNKKSGGTFTHTDEQLCKTFCVYCALALRYTRIQKQISSTKELNNIFLKMLQLQVKPCIHDLMLYCADNMEITIPSEFDHFTWYINNEDHVMMPQFCLYMILEVTNGGNIDPAKTMQYFLSVRKFYRNVPFHNFEHAFNVCHCMHLMLKRNAKRFRPLEAIALFIAALSHDVDHGGLTNNFLELTRDDLSHLYESSILENHQFYITMFLLDHNKVFRSISKEDYAVLREEIKAAILATDMQTYFMNQAKLQRILYDDMAFNWNNELHRTYLKSIMMTSADLSGLCKPFLVSKRILDNLYIELYKQGDLEKDMGLCPLSFMDREHTRVVPEDQVSFLTAVAIPCLDLLRQFLPNTEVLSNEAKVLKQTWQDVIDVRGKKCWRQDDSIVNQLPNN